MSLKNLLVAFNGSTASEAALRYACAAVRDNGGHVTALLAHATNEVVNSRDAWVPPAARAIIAEANSSILSEVELRFEALRADLALGERLHFQRAAGRVDAVIAECARSYDIIVVGNLISGGADPHVAVHPDRVALMSGRPVLVIPDDYQLDAPHAHAAVAWDGSRAAARALSDSLHILQQQGRVSVLTVGKKPLPRPVEELMQHLERQGVQAEHQNLPQPTSVGSAIVRYCAEQDPCMLVMGAYEHSKFREDFFGGITAKVLKKIKTPLLLSH